MAEDVEGRELAKGKTGEHTRVRTQCRRARQRALAHAWQVKFIAHRLRDQRVVRPR
jgi:hypothetical protein